jgi:hypothetical protein
MLKLPVGLTDAPFCRLKFPATPVRPVSALFVLVAVASATHWIDDRQNSHNLLHHLMEAGAEFCAIGHGQLLKNRAWDSRRLNTLITITSSAFRAAPPEFQCQPWLTMRRLFPL